MSRIQLMWDEETRTIIRSADYGWTWRELELANDELSAFLDTIPHDVCTIVMQNYRQHYMPPHPLTKLGTMITRKHPRVRMSVVVSSSSFVRSILELVMKIYPAAVHLRFANSLEEARMLIREYWAQHAS